MARLYANFCWEKCLKILPQAVSERELLVVYRFDLWDIGSIGSSGRTSAQDEQCAQSSVNALGAR